ncbi:armadillo-type protein [Phellopilus nigrolimitatus]|nr:armadillo-type protein [Phellopilus nigrolimitatus]
MVAQTRKGGSNSPGKLKFADKLVGKGLSGDALLKKLKALHAELAELDQDNVDTKSLRPVCKELISTSIFLHKDKGVKAFAACCLADILRLFAPDAPYTGPELRDIFQFFFRQLAVGLKGSNAPFYNEYFHLLESLSTVKSVVLVCDLPQAEELMTQIFRDFFGLVRQELAKNIEMFMSDILIALIDECPMLPSEVLETMMAQFMDKNARMDQPAYRLAVEVCNATSDKLQRHVCQYFTDNIVQHAQAEDYEEVARCHALIKRLNGACPALLHNVVPQLEEELRVEELQLRTLATQVLGEMFADKAGGDLEKKYPSTWTLWLARRNDKAAQVRLAFVEGCKGLLLHHRLELREAVEDSLQTKLFDPDEKVRAAVCKLYAQLDYETALHYVSEKQLRTVGDRAMDKKQSVRQEALASVGRLYSIAYPEIENNDSAAIKQFAWIPQQVLYSITSTTEVKSVALQVIAEYILPVPSKGDDEVAWTDRLLTVMRFLDEKGIATLLNISTLKLQRPSHFERYLQYCIDNNGGIIDADEDMVKKRLAAAIRMLSTLFPDPQKAAEDLQTFAKVNEQRLYKLLKTCMDPQTDLKGLVKASSEFTRRVEQSMPSILPTMMSFFRQASLWIVNLSSVPTLVKRLQKGDHHTGGKSTSLAQVMADNAQTLLTTMSKSCPAVYRSHISEFTKAIADEKNPRLVEVCLQALAAVCKNEPGITPSDKRSTERLVRYAHGTHPRHAKFAARVIAFTKNKEDLCSEVVQFIADELPKADSDILVAHIAVLVEIVRFAPDAFEHKSDVIVAFLLKETLLRPGSSDAGSMDIDEDADEWTEEDNLPALAKAKILALKVCRHRCLVHSKTETALDVATPVLKLLITILENGGLISENSHDEPTVKSRLRLQAAWSLVQLASVEKFSEIISPNFVLLAVTIQDPCFNVRQIFLAKLTTYIATRKIPPRFNVIPFLTAHDPEDEIREKARGLIIHQFSRSLPDIRLLHWETIFIRLLHVLAHHPDFGLEEQQALDLAKYIRLYLSLIATADNVSLLYNLAQKCKTVRDAQSHVYSEVGLELRIIMRTHQ